MQFYLKNKDYNIICKQKSTKLQKNPWKFVQLVV